MIWHGGSGVLAPYTGSVYQARCSLGGLGPHLLAWLGPRPIRSSDQSPGRWVGLSGPCRHQRRRSGCVVPALPSLLRTVKGPALRVGSGDTGMSPGGGMSPIRWRGGEAAVGTSLQLPAALVHGPVVGPAEQGQIRQVGGAAMQPVAQVVGVAPGQGPLAVGEDTAAVADGQSGALAGLDDPGGPSDLQGLGGGAAKGRWEQPLGGPELFVQPVGPAGVVGLGCVSGRWGRGRDGGGRGGGG